MLPKRKDTTWIFISGNIVGHDHVLQRFTKYFFHPNTDKAQTKHVLLPIRILKLAVSKIKQNSSHCGLQEKDSRRGLGHSQVESTVK